MPKYIILTIHKCGVTCEKEEIAFGSETIEDADLEKSKESIITAGVNGEKHRIYEQKTVDGVVDEKVLIEERVVLEPVKQFKAIGTKVAVAPSTILRLKLFRSLRSDS